jgi:hypothetical protein
MEPQKQPLQSPSCFYVRNPCSFCFLSIFVRLLLSLAGHTMAGGLLRVYFVEYGQGKCGTLRQGFDSVSIRLRQLTWRLNLPAQCRLPVKASGRRGGKNRQTPNPHACPDDFSGFGITRCWTALTGWAVFNKWKNYIIQPLVKSRMRPSELTLMMIS